MSDPCPVYYSLADLVERLAFSYTTVRGWYLAGEFSGPAPVVRVGSDIRIPWSNVQSFLQRNTVHFEPRAVRERRIADRQLEPGVPARNAGELRRKIKLRGEVASDQSHTLVSAGSTPPPATN